MSVMNKLSKGMDGVITLLVGLFLLAPAVLFQTGSPDPQRVFNEIAAITAGWALLVALAVAGLINGKPYLSGGAPSWTKRLFVVLVAWLGLGAMWAVQPWIAWGHAFSVATLALVGFGLKGWVDERPARRWALLGALGASAAVQGAVMTLQALHAPWLNWGAAVQGAQWLPGHQWLASFLLSLATAEGAHAIMGSLGNPNTLGEALVLFLPVLAAWAWASTHGRWRLLATVPLIATFAGLVAAGGRGALLGLVLFIPIALLAVWGKRVLAVKDWAMMNRGKTALIAVGLIAVVAGGLASGRLTDKLRRDIRTDDAVAARLINWQVGVNLLGEQPLLGTGLGSYKLRNVAKTMADRPDGVPRAAWEERFIWLHNEPLQLAVETGLVGLLLALATLAAWWRETWKNRSLTPALRFGLLAGMGAFWVAGSFGFPLHVAAVATPLVVVVVLGLSRPESDEPASVRVHPAWGVTAVALTMAVVAVGLPKEVWPEAEASRLVYVADQLIESGEFKGASSIYGQAARLQRFKGLTLELQAQALYGQRQYAEVVAVIDDNQREGLGYGAGFWKALALNQLGRRGEAIAEIQRVAKFCGTESLYGRKANYLLQEWDKMPAEPLKLKSAS